MPPLDEVQAKIDRFEKYVQAIADERDQLRRKVRDLELALELASSTAKSRYNHWSYQTYLFLKYFFCVEFRCGRAYGYVYLHFYLATPLLGFMLRKSMQMANKRALETGVWIYWRPNLPIQTGVQLYRHSWGINLSERVIKEGEK